MSVFRPVRAVSGHIHHPRVCVDHMHAYVSICPLVCPHLTRLAVPLAVCVTWCNWIGLGMQPRSLVFGRRSAVCVRESVTAVLAVLAVHCT